MAKGFGTLIWRGKSWHFVFVDSDGKRKSRSLKTTSKAKAHEMRRQIIARITAERLTGDGQSARIAEAAHNPIDGFVDAWGATMRDRRLAPLHVKVSTSRLRSVLTNGGIDRPPQFTLDAVRAGIAAHDHWSDQSRRHAFAVAKTFGNWLVRAGVLRSNPLAGITPPKVETVVHPRRIPSISERQNLLRVARTRKTPKGTLAGLDRWWLYRLAGLTGFRLGELLSLRPQSFRFDEQNGAIRCKVALAGADSKDGNAVLQPLPDDQQTLMALRSWVQSKGQRLFSTTKWMNFNRIFRTDCRHAGIISPDAAGLYFDFHSLRHLYVTELAATGASIETVRRLARHKSVQTTMRYMHTSDDEMRDAVNRIGDQG